MDEPTREELGRRGVTRRELDVLDAVAERLSNAEVATRLFVSERTVESHVASLLRKLGAGNRSELARSAAGGGRTRRLEARFPRQLATVAERGPCVGRDAERQRLLACWDRAASRTIVAVLRGEAGIGKSRLAADVAREVHNGGGAVALGMCTDEPRRAYEPFMTAVDDDVARLSDDELRRCLGTSAATFARLSPEVATRLSLVRPDSVDPHRERAAVQEAVHDYLSRAARAKRLLLVIEDLHWASVGTLDIVAEVARGGDAPLMLLVTTRDEPPFADARLRAFLGRIATLPSVEILSLSGLDVAAAASVIAAVGGDVDPDVGVRLTGGNPLFLREVAREGPGSRTLGELVADRFERLCPGDLEVLDIAAVAGEQIDVSRVASALDRSTDDVLDAIERAEAVGLIGPGARAGWFAFAHDVFRSVRYASISASRRMRLHAALAQALRDQAENRRVIGDLARHACLAGPRFDPAVAAELARHAGDLASDATDHSEAAAHYRRAHEVLDLVPGADDELSLRLSIRLGASLVLIADADGLPTLRAAAEEAQRRGDAVALADAICAMAAVPGGNPSDGRPDAVFRSLADTALDLLPATEAAWRVRVLAIVGSERWFSDAPTQGAEMVYAAVSAARQLGDPVVLGQALLPYRFCLPTVDMDERIACGHELIKLGDLTGLEVFACVGRQQLWWCYRELGNRDAMERWFEAAAERTRRPDIEQASQAAAVALIDGDLNLAEWLNNEIAEVWQSTTLAAVYTAGVRWTIEAWRGHTSHLADVERLVAGGYFQGLLNPALALGWARAGRSAKARDLLDQARQRGFPPMYAGRGGSAPISQWAETAALLKDIPAGAELGELLEPLAGRLVDGGTVVLDTVDRIRALLRLASGDPAGAAELATDAVAASRRRRTPIFLARELIVLAAAKRQLGIDPSDTTRAVDEALAIARRTGARVIDQDAGLLLGGSPVDRFGLTAREREILDLIADGATNTHIADTLRVSPATVRKHLEHVYEKLHVSTRTAAVARARRDA